MLADYTWLTEGVGLHLICFGGNVLTLNSAKHLSMDLAFCMGHYPVKTVVASE